MLKCITALAVLAEVNALNLIFNINPKPIVRSGVSMTESGKSYKIVGFAV